MLTLKGLKFGGIGRFVDGQSLDVARLSNLVQIDGYNKNTGGSSGAGKSTVFNALDYLLGLNDIPNGTLQSRLTKTGIWVEGDFDWDGKALTIRRTKKGLAILEEGKEPVEGSSKLAEEKLDEILGIPRELFSKILHKRQDERGFFLKLTPKEIHEFLTDTLGLEQYREKIDQLDIMLKIKTEETTSNSRDVGVFTASRDACANALVSMGVAPEQLITKDHIEKLSAYYAFHKEQLAKLTQEQLAIRGEHERVRPAVKITPYDRSRIESFQEQLRQIGEQAQSLSSVEIARQTEVQQKIMALKLQRETATYRANAGMKAKQDAIRVAEEVKLIRAATCPTCAQHWATESAKTKEEELLTKLKGFKEVIQKGQEAEALVADITAQITDLEPQVKPLKIQGLAELLAKKDVISADLTTELQLEKAHRLNEASVSQEALNKWSEEGRLLQNKHAAESDQLRNETGKAFNELSAAEHRFKAAEEAASRYNTQYYLHSQNLAKWEEKLKTATDRHSALVEQVVLIEDAKKLIKSFMSCSFEEALQSIGDGATTMIRNIPNMANATITIEGTKETAKGAVKEEVNAVLNVDGEEAVPLRSLSGGERTSVDLAVDLAVIDLIQTKTNKGINVFVLDEPFTGLESINIEPILELLKQANLGKKLFVVDHNPIIKESIQDRVIVVREGSESILQNSLT